PTPGRSEPDLGFTSRKPRTAPSYPVSSPAHAETTTRVKVSYLFRGLPGHPLHPPLTDATIGTYTVATALAIADVTDASKNAAAGGWWLALLFGLCLTVPTALSGLADWLTITWRSPLWWTATSHLLAMVSATVFFGLAAIFGHAGWKHGDVTTGPFVLTAVGFG